MTRPVFLTKLTPPPLPQRADLSRLADTVAELGEGDTRPEAHAPPRYVPRKPLATTVETSVPSEGYPTFHKAVGPMYFDHVDADYLFMIEVRVRISGSSLWKTGALVKACNLKSPRHLSRCRCLAQWQAFPRGSFTW